MKNVYLLPTDKPSRLFIDVDDNKLKICIPLGGEHMLNQNIYITDDSEIREGDWYYHLERKTVHNTSEKADYFVNNTKYGKFKKIILTDNEDLIKNGVQSIDDEFLEWFCKNSSCESVNLENHVLEVGYNKYKIIIPQKEPKQECECKRAYINVLSGICSLCWNERFPDEKDEIKEEDLLEPKQDYTGVHLTHCYQGEYEDSCKYGDNDCPAKPLEIKQESLEEAGKRCFEEMKALNPTGGIKEFIRMAVNFGANWQSERSFTEEEVKDILIQYLHYLTLDSNLDADEWFKQFSKFKKQ
jgi:hypothetical protein